MFLSYGFPTIDEAASTPARREKILENARIIQQSVIKVGPRQHKFFRCCECCFETTAHRCNAVINAVINDGLLELKTDRPPERRAHQAARRNKKPSLAQSAHEPR